MKLKLEYIKPKNRTKLNLIYHKLRSNNVNLTKEKRYLMKSL